MRIRRAIGAAGLVLVATAGLAGCADDPKDKAFGGLGDLDDMPSAPSAPSLPSPGSSGGYSGGSDSGSSSSGLTGGSTDRPTPSAPPTYNSSALGEVDGERCRYSRSLGQISYDVEIQNASSEQAFKYNFTVTFKIGSSPNSSIATRTIGTRFKTVTVSPSGSRTVTVDVSHSTNERMVYSCQVTSATKYPATP
ncbi:hypothetical protein [Streptomyces spirodelae]|uniref:Uncharacterized protein n=1 Tax=Streptomyces spirodelae TaxID=2812904 RepID=A0ABS3WUV3_9ACTN|nr:hypothetical protein [Streptomyces spirodelae]MBO8186651.1 hypothetical protein [Streptomyces spirodelae]